MSLAPSPAPQPYDFPPPPAPAADPNAPLYRAATMNRGQGRLGSISVYRNRIEFRSSRGSTEVIPMRAVTSVETMRVGFRYDVAVRTAGGELVVRVTPKQAEQLKAAVMDLVLAL